MDYVEFNIICVEFNMNYVDLSWKSESRFSAGEYGYLNIIN